MELQALHYLSVENFANIIIMAHLLLSLAGQGVRMRFSHLDLARVVLQFSGEPVQCSCGKVCFFLFDLIHD